MVRQAGYGSRLGKALLEAGLLIIGNFPSKYLKRQGTITPPFGKFRAGSLHLDGVCQPSRNLLRQIQSRNRT